MVTKTGQRGRPTKPAKEGEKTTLSLRVTPELKRRLDVAATQSGRNLSQEAEHRLELTIENERAIQQALEFAYGPRVAGLALFLARVMQVTSNRCEYLLKGTAVAACPWHDVPEAFQKVVDNVNLTLMVFRPNATARRSRSGNATFVA